MNNSTFICALLIFLPLFLSTVAASPTPLLVQTCKKTSDYSLCVSSLLSDPRTVSARNVKTLALIELDTISAKANVTTNHIARLMENATDTWVYRVYGICINSFLGIVENRVPQAVAALKSADYAAAKDYAGEVKSDVLLCFENAPSDNPPFKKEADLVQQLGGVAVGIINLLH